MLSNHESTCLAQLANSNVGKVCMLQNWWIEHCTRSCNFRQRFLSLTIINLISQYDHFSTYDCESIKGPPICVNMMSKNLNIFIKCLIPREVILSIVGNN